LSNAMKYSGRRRILRVRIGQSGEQAFAALTDKGIGIPAEAQPRVFEKFYRVRNEVTDAVPGAGLGLTLVEHITHAHGGRVTLESSPGQGSTFTLWFPLLPPMRETENAELRAGAVESVAP
jgi:signal transduction histidine kinase